MKTKILLIYLLLSLNMVWGQTWTNYNTSNSDLQDANVTSLALDNSGNLWIGTFYNGLIKFDGTTFTKISTLNTGFTANRVYTIYFDGSEIWVGTGNGVFKQNGNNWINYNSQNSGLINNNVNAIVKDNSNNLYFGTDTTLCKLSNSNNWSTINSSNSDLFDGGINSLCYANNNLWVAVDNSGVSKFDGTNWTNYYPGSNSIHDFMVTKIAIDNSNKKWFGGYNNCIRTFDNINWLSYNNLNSTINSNQIYDIAFDGNYKWIATENGVSLFDGTNWTNFTATNSGIGSNYLNASAIIVANNGIKWIGLFGGGITKLNYLLNNENFEKNKVKVYPNPTDNFIVIDSYENVENYKIFDDLGRIFQEGKFEEKIDISTLSKGSYFLQINKNQIVKFIKK